MNDLLLRRRALMASLKEDPYSNYAVTAQYNPEMMAAIYANGWSASPDYITIQEAEAVTNESLGLDGCTNGHCDLRYFINYTGGISTQYTRTLHKITFPNRDNPFPVNTVNYLSTSGDLVVIIPEGVISLDYLCLNRNVRFNCICESATPPRNKRNANQLFASSKYEDSTIWVPDSSVETYQSTSPWNKYVIRPISECPKEIYDPSKR